MPDDQQPEETAELSEREQGRQRGAALAEEARRRWRGKRELSPGERRQAVEDLCRAEFLETWGYEFGEASRLRLVEAIRVKVASARAEREARRIAEDIRELAPKILRFLRETEEHEGGAWAALLRRTVLPQLGIDEQGLARLFSCIPTPQTLTPKAFLTEERIREMKRYNFRPPQGDLDRYALVHVANDALATTIEATMIDRPMADRLMTARELAVVSCLLGIPWGGEAETPDAGPRHITPAKFIEREADRLVRDLTVMRQEESP